MPINVFSRQAMNNSVNQGLGMNLQGMIQNGMGQAMGDVEERRQMGRRKYASDMLSQNMQQAELDLANQKQMLENEQSRYHFGQEQEYYGGLHTPAGQAAMRAYSERLGIPQVGDITTPEGIKVHQAFGGQIGAGHEHDQAMAVEILRSYGPQAMLMKPGTPMPPEVQWAQRILGAVPEGQNQGGQSSGTLPANTAQPPSAPRSALATFVHGAVPQLVGAGTGGLAYAKVPGPWPVKLGAAGVGYLAGERAADWLGGNSAQDVQEHPTANALGQATGLALGLFSPSGMKQVFGTEAGPVAGLKGYIQRGLGRSAPAGVSAAGESGGAATAVSREFPASDMPRVAQPGSILKQPKGAPRPTPSMGNVTTNPRVMKKAPNPAAKKPSMSNVATNPNVMQPTQPPMPSMGNIAINPNVTGVDQAIRSAVAEFLLTNGRPPSPEELSRLLHPR